MKKKRTVGEMESSVGRKRAKLEVENVPKTKEELKPEGGKLLPKVRLKGMVNAIRWLT